MRSLRFCRGDVVAGILTGCLISLINCGVWAQNGTWTNTGSGDYNSAANWAGNQIAMGAGNTADFSTLDISSDVRVTLNSPLTIGNLLFGDTNTATGGSWEFFTDNLATAILTLDNAGSKPNITVNPLVPAIMFDDAFIGHSLAGTMGFNKLGAGILTLGPGTTNTITGDININEGTLRINAVIPGQVITIGNGATLETAVTLDAGTPAPGHQINVEPGNTATINTTATVELGNFDADGATLNINLAAMGSTLTADGNWAINGSPAAVNISSSEGGFFRMRPNSGSPGFDTTTAFANSALHLDNIVIWTRTNSFGNNVNIGALTGTDTAVIAGGAQGGGTAARYIIGALNTDTEYAGSFDTTVDLPDPEAGLHIIKVGTGTLTLSGTVNNVPRVAGGATTLPWRRGGVTQIQNGTIALVDDTVIAGGAVDATVGEMYTTIEVQADGTFDVTGYTAGTYATQNLQQVIGPGNIVGDWNHSDGFIRPADTVPDLAANPGITSSDTIAVGGTITFNGNLNLTGGSIGYDMTLDPNSGNDLIHVTGSTNVTGGTIVPRFFSGIPSSGTYTVLTADGGITGNVAAMTVDLPGRGTDPVPFLDGNSIKFNAVAGGGSADLIWSGANGGIWDVETTQAWTNNGSPDVFFDLDNVTFNDNPANAVVTVADVVSPTSITLNNPTTAYTFMASGSGSISGTTGFTKTGAGNLTMQIGNSYTGPTSLQGGTIDIGTSGTAFGVGTLAIDGVNIVGTTAGGFGNTSLAAAGTNTISMEGNAGSGNTFTLPALTGSGSLTITSTVADKWFALNDTSGYTGTVNLSGPDGQTPIHVRIVANSSFGVLNMNDARVSARSGTGGGTSTFAIAELHGDDNTRLRAFEGGSPAVNAVWQIGSANTDSEFAGIIEDGAGSNMTTSTSAVTKVGTGTLSLTGVNTYTGDTRVEGGTLRITNSYLADAANVFIDAGAMLNLDFFGDDVINSLYLDGVPQNPGFYGAGAMGASFFAGTGRLEVTMLGPPLDIDGDFSGNGSVENADLTLLLDNWGASVPPVPAGWIGAQPTAPAIDNDELTALLDNWGASQAAGSASLVGASGVPEPSTAALAALVLLGSYLPGLRIRRGVQERLLGQD